MPTAGNASPCCRACGYPLHGLDSRHCPECGHGFDPADPKTMNLGRRPGRLARWLMLPVGWPTLTVMFAATAAIVATTRPQEGAVWEWRFALHDLRYYSAKELWALDRPLVVWTDYLYVVGASTAALTLLWATLREIASGFARRILNGQPGLTISSRRLLGGITTLGLIAFFCVGVGWSFRLGTHWSAARTAGLAPTPNLRVSGTGPVLAQASHFAIAMTDADVERAIGSARVYGDEAARLGAIAILVEANCTQGEPRRQLLDSAARERDIAIRATVIRLLGLMRHQDDLAIFVRLLDHEDGRLREAAANALAYGRDLDISYFLCGKDFLLRSQFKHGGLTLGLSKFLFIAPARDVDGDGIADVPQPVTWPPGTEAKLMQRVQNGTTAVERDAAAYALAVGQVPPTGIRLRHAELGVWHAGKARPADARDQLDKEPAVLQSEEPALVGTHSAVLNISRPLVATIQAEFAAGGVSHARPAPDEASESFKMRYGQGLIARRSMGTSTWRHPPYLHLPEASLPRMFRGPNDLMVSSGVVWRAIALLDSRPTSDDVDPNRMPESFRDVRSAWLSTKGDATQQLTLRSAWRSPPAVAVAMRADDTLNLKSLDIVDGDPAEDQPDFASVSAIDAQDQTARRGRRTQRRGMYVSVVDGVATAEIVPVPKSGKSADPAEHQIGTGTIVRDIQPSDATETVSGATQSARDSTPTGSNATRGHSPRRGSDGATAALLREWVIDAGLTAAEADALLADWNKPLFQTDGRRFLLLLSAVDYDSLCPIHIKPAPTEMARVGIVWTEFEKGEGR